MDIPLELCHLGYCRHPNCSQVLANNKLYLLDHKYLKNETVACYDHNHILFFTDNGSVFDNIKGAISGSKYQLTITPFKRVKDGRGSFLAMKDQLLDQ